ncbi:MAG: DUF3107 domain-containing protein [Mobiluncus sp.]|uniref:DUF3107 domain-containing protein n=1 Tax=Mobiluncus sp. TaxID=47293 RepID=UPI002583650C|nr:DUF3107 domain-containing protein [Mobiluncus sp.]MCI6584240.1 DUF3107 domain-containing protein [Mobiluncus sp.]
MEIKIGMKSVPREIALDVDASFEDLKKKLKQAIEKEELLDLVDKRDSHTLLSGRDIAYVEFSPEQQTRIGFAI